MFLSVCLSLLDIHFSFSPIERLIGGWTPLIACVGLVANIILMLLLRRRWWRRRWRCGLLIVCVVTWRCRAVMARLRTVGITVTCTGWRSYTAVIISRITTIVTGQTRRRILNVHRHQVGTTIQNRHMLCTTRARQRDSADFLRLFLHRYAKVSMVYMSL